MNASIKFALTNPQSRCFQLSSAFFHSTRFLDRVRRNYWNTRYNNSNNYRRSRNNRFRQNMLRNMNAYAEHLLHSWQSEFDHDDDESNEGPSFFRRPPNGSRRNWTHSQGRQTRGRRGFSFGEEEEDDDDDDVDRFFHDTKFENSRYSSFKERCHFSDFQSEFDHDDHASGPSSFRRPHNGSRRNWTDSQGRETRGRRGFRFCEGDDDDDVDRFFFWTFVSEDYRNRRSSSQHYNGFKTSWKRRQQSEDEYEYISEDDIPNSDLASERIALGLSASGPLKLEDVKNAYRVCALQWHPDRHQGSSKASAEEKFKLCTAAYQSLCDKLAVN